MRILVVTCCLLLALASAACSRPQPPDPERPPEPQAQQHPERPRTETQHTELRDAIQRPIEKAKGVEAQLLDAAKQQQADIDAQTGG